MASPICKWECGDHFDSYRVIIIHPPIRYLIIQATINVNSYLQSKGNDSCHHSCSRNVWQHKQEADEHCCTASLQEKVITPPAFKILISAKLLSIRQLEHLILSYQSLTSTYKSKLVLPHKYLQPCHRNICMHFIYRIKRILMN